MSILQEPNRITVAFFSFSRSDYASIKNVIIDCYKTAAIKPIVIAGGSHLHDQFGCTIEDFEEDGIAIDRIIDFLPVNKTDGLDFAMSLSKAIKELSTILYEIKPDFVFLLGDRWELIAPAIVASRLSIPIAHHSGGDITEGSSDNQTRYALTSLSHYHFTALEDHSQRLMAIGEEPWRVVTVGEPALIGLSQKLANQDEFYRCIRLRADEDFVLATFHPTSFEALGFDRQIQIFLEAIKDIDQTLVMTAPNPDEASSRFYSEMVKFCEDGGSKRIFVETMGQDLYYTAMANAKYMIGNSSSGLWEAPSFGLPVINIGSRQDGRKRMDNVLDVALDVDEIRNAIDVVQSEEFLLTARQVTNPYVNPNTNELIFDKLLSEVSLENLLAKKFVDPLRRALD